MDIRTNSELLIPITVSFIIPVIWLLNRSILISYGRDVLKEGIKWFKSRPILIPTLAVFLLPIFTAYLTLNQIPDILKIILPLITFIVGQFIGRYDKQSEIKNKQLEILLILQRKLSIICEKISLNKSILEIELDSINKDDRGFVESRLQTIDKITEEFSKLDICLALTNENILTIDDLFNFRKVSTIIEQFNELIKERREYRSKCRELTSNSLDQYFHLLEQTDRELLKIAESFEQTIDELSKDKIKL